MKKNGLFTAALIMATSAIGPGFLTQTTIFTERLLYNFGFVILFSIFIDIVAQVTIWKTISFSNSPIQKLADDIFSGLGKLLIISIAFGGLVFNIGNLSGSGMGLNALFELPISYGCTISAIIAAALFYSDNFLPKLDAFVKVMVVVMAGLLVCMLFLSDFDSKKMIHYMVFPARIDVKSTITLVGGTIGGYISFAGVQRLLDAETTGKENQKQVERSAYSGILITGFFRLALFLAILGVVLGGINLNSENPTQTVFLSYFGVWGSKLFGVMIWSASITSVIGATYTSISFLHDLHPTFKTKRKVWALLFILISLLINLAYGKPVKLLLYAGYLNAFILPLGLVIILISLHKNPNLKELKISWPMQLGAALIAIVLAYFGIKSLF